MKFLVLFAGVVATTSAIPLESSYGQPAAPPLLIPQPIEQVTLPELPPVLEPGVVTFRQVTPPLAPTRILSPAPFPALASRSPLSLVPNRALPAPLAPRALPLPAPLAPRALPAPIAPRALPLPAPLAPRAPLNLVAGRQAPLPLAPAPLPLAAAPAPLPLAARPAPIPFPAGRAPLPFAPSPLPLAAAPTPLPLAAAPVAPSSQFHAQDELGGFSFGYQNLNSAKQEIRTPDGVTRGSYSYIDANGVPQKVEYIADPLNGFRVAATNLPVAPDAPIVDALAPLAASPVVVVDTPEVAAAKAEFQIAFEKAVARNAAAAEAGEFPEERPVAELRKKRSALGAGYGIPAAPVVQVPTPVVPVPAPQVARIVAPIAPVVPGPVRVAASPIPVPAPLPFAAAPVVQVTPRVASPVPIPAPVTPLTRALPLPSPLAAPLVRASPLPVGPIPAPLPVAPAPLPLAAAAPSSQFHAQDEAGGFSFGYQTLNSARQESRRPDGVTTGSYSYVDANGIPQTVNYIADALGFRVAGTNLPVAPVA